MDTKKEAKKYLNKYFKAQYINETDDEFKDLVKILNEALRIHDVVGRSEQLSKLNEHCLSLSTNPCKFTGVCVHCK
jgi:hypothetical protein